jgi:ABC-type nitrate/sulfonate/bicarbonate transport system substrate-binding protein
VHSKVAIKLAGAIYESGHWANRNHDASTPLLAQYTKMAPSMIARMHRGRFAESSNVALTQPVIDVAATYGFIPQPFPAAELYYRP